MSGTGDQPVETNMTDRSSYKPDAMVPALGVVGGTPGWAVRGKITCRSPPASHASHDCAVLAPLRDRLLSLIQSTKNYA